MNTRSRGNACQSPVGLGDFIRLGVRRQPQRLIQAMRHMVGRSWKCVSPTARRREDRDVRPGGPLLGTVSRCGDVGCCGHDQRVVPEGQTARKRTTVPADPIRLTRNAFVIMALRMRGTSTCHSALWLPAAEGYRPGQCRAFGPLRRVNGPERLIL